MTEKLNRHHSIRLDAAVLTLRAVRRENTKRLEALADAAVVKRLSDTERAAVLADDYAIFPYE